MSDVNKLISTKVTTVQGTIAEVYKHHIVRDRTSTPDYTYKVVKGIHLPDQPYMFSLKLEQKPLVRVDRYRGIDNDYSYDTQGSFSYYPPQTNGAEWHGKLLSAATSSFYENAKGGELELGIALAEAPQTFRLIGLTAFRIANAMYFLRRGRIHEAFKALGVVNRVHMKELERRYRSTKKTLSSRLSFAASALLELQYGWKPLLSDVYSAAEDLGNRFAVNHKDIVIRGSSGSVRCELESTSNVVSSPTELRVRTEGPENYNSKRYGVVCHAQIVDDGLRSRAALGLANPAHVLWNVVPWSFVADWFLPIGDYLAALGATDGLRFVTGSRTELHKTYASYSQVGDFRDARSGLWHRQKGVLEYSYKEINFSRTVLANFPSTSEVLRIKSLDKALSLTHVANALALLKLRFSQR